MIYILRLENIFAPSKLQVRTDTRDEDPFFWPISDAIESELSCHSHSQGSVPRTISKIKKNVMNILDNFKTFFFVFILLVSDVLSKS